MWLLILLLAVGTQSLPLVPNPTLTPGSVLPNVTKADVCTPGWATSHRDVSEATKREVFSRYGITPNGKAFEVDHLISLQLGGDNSLANLWPQSYETPTWNAHTKDALENRLHWLVCHDQISLTEAQTAIRGDWRRAYQQYMK